MANPSFGLGNLLENPPPPHIFSPFLIESMAMEATDVENNCNFIYPNKKLEIIGDLIENGIPLNNKMEC